MELYKLTTFDPYLNLAAEEYFLKYSQSDMFIIWQNENTIVVGRNQDTYSEINSLFVHENKIKVVRRTTGGGAVYHDLGNVNFSIIIRNKKTLDSLESYLTDIIDFLHSKNIDAHFKGRNDICYLDKKISGLATTIYKDSILVHGTLLFNVNIEKLVNALNVSKVKLISKGVESVKARVTNLNSIYDGDVCDFIKDLMKFLENKYHRLFQEYDPKLNNEIVSIAINKFSNPDWVFGKNFDFNFQNEIKSAIGVIKVHLQLNNGIISKIKFFTDSLQENINFDNLELALLEQPYNIDKIKKIIPESNLKNFILNLDYQEFINLLFKNN